MSTSPWKNFTREDWDNVLYCDDCGLPLLMDEDTNKTFCVYCTWMGDQEVIENGLRTEIDRLRKVVAQAKEKGAYAMIPEGPPTKDTEVIRVNGVTFVNAEKHGRLVDDLYKRINDLEWKKLSKEVPPIMVYVETLTGYGAVQGNMLMADKQSWAFGDDVLYWRHIQLPDGWKQDAKKD